MEYWVRSCPPLAVRKVYLKNFEQVLEWMEYVLAQTQKIYEEKGEIFVIEEEKDLFKKCFVLVEIDLERNPAAKKIFCEDSESKKWKEENKIQIPKMEELFKKMFSHAIVKTIPKKRKKYKDVSLQKRSSTGVHVCSQSQTRKRIRKAHP